MNRQKKILLLLSLVLVLIAAGTIVLLRSGQGRDSAGDGSMNSSEDGSRRSDAAGESADSSNASGSGNGVLYETDPSQIDTVTVKNQSGTYSVRLTEDSAALQNYPDVPIDTEGIEAFFHYASIVRYLDTLSGGKDDGEYGLSDPRASVKVLLKDQSSYEFSFGDVVPGQNTAEARYMKSGDRIYTTFSLYAQPFFRSEESYIDHQVTPVSMSLSDAAATSETILNVTDLWIRTNKGEDFSVSLRGTEDVLGYMLQNYELSAGGSIYPFTSDAAGVDFLSSVFNLTADSIVCVHPSEQDLAEYGLMADALSAEVSWQSVSGLSGSFELSISSPGEDGIFLIKKDTDVIYHLSSVPLFCTADWQTLVSTYLLMPSLDELSGVILETPEKQVRFEPDGKTETVRIKTGTAAETDFSPEPAQPDESPEQSVSLADFRSFYAALIQMKADRLVLPVVETKELPIAGRITYEFASGETMSIALYKLSARKLLAAVDGRQYELSSVIWENILSALEELN